MEPLAFHRVIALLRTDQNLEQKLVRLRSFALSQSRLSTVIGFLDLLRKVSISYEFKSPLLSILHFFSPNATLLCNHNLLVARFPQVFVPQNRARKDFAHEVHLFWIMPPECPSPSRILFRTRCIPRISWCVPPKPSNPNFLACRRIEFIGSEF